jgi:hypothetical protein
MGVTSVPGGLSADRPLPGPRAANRGRGGATHPRSAEKTFNSAERERLPVFRRIKTQPPGKRIAITVTSDMIDEAHARRASSGSRRAARGGRRANDHADSHKVRGWAKEHGMDIHERGRVPAEVFAQYQAADGQ